MTMSKIQIGAIVLLAAALLAAVSIAVWPASEADKAREDGEQMGQAVAQLYDAQTSAEVEDALVEMSDAAADAREHGGDAVAEQVTDQEAALARAADGVIGALESDDEFEAELYQAELEIALDDLESQAADFRSEGPEVQTAYWEGVEEGLSAE